jgi:hypothetical protein
VFGPGHLLRDPDRARSALESEMLTLDLRGTDEPRVERIHPEGLAFRVNLRPYKEEGGSSDILVQAMCRSIPLFPARRKDFLDLWEGARALSEAERIPFPHELFHDLEETVDWQALPSLHHSPRYRALNRPSYRVVHRNVMADLGLI